MDTLIESARQIPSMLQRTISALFDESDQALQESVADFKNSAANGINTSRLK